MKKVALGCSEPQPCRLGVRPVGVAAFHEQVQTTIIQFVSNTLGLSHLPSLHLLFPLSPQGTIFLLLGCTSISSYPVPSDGRSPPLVGTPPCTCWLLAFEASVTTACTSGVPSTCRLLQTYRPPEQDHGAR